jgi:hypothetical protein
VSGGRQEAAGAQHKRFEQIGSVTGARDHHHAYSGQKQQSRTSVAMMTNVGARVADDADGCRGRDNQPLKPFVGEMMQPEDG